jgi:phosphate-selective porin OprO/OprP
MFAGTANAEAKADTSLDSEVEHYLENSSGQAGAPADFRVFWKDGLQMESGDGNFTAHIRGRAFFDTDFADSDDNASSELGDNHVGFSSARIGVEGTMFKNAIYKIEVKFVGDDGNFSFADVYMGLAKVGPGTILFGRMKRPFGLNYTTSTRYLSFSSRAPSVEALNPTRGQGIGWFGNFTETKRVFLGVGTFFNGNSAGSSEGQGGWGLTFRVAGLAIENADKDMLLSLGLSLQWQNLRMNNQLATYSAGTGSSLGFIDGDRAISVVVAAKDEIRYAVEISFKIKGVHMQAEYFWASPNSISGSDPTFSGYYAQVGWFITGESRSFKKGNMAWSRTAPKANFWTGDGGRGAWEIAIRFDGTDLNDKGFTGGKMSQIAAGVNWYWNPNMRMMFTYYNVDMDTDDATINVLVVRWQFDF